MPIAPSCICWSKPRKKFPCAGAIVRIHLQPGIDKRPDQPRPDSALMIRGIARSQVAVVAGLVIGMSGRQRPQSVGRQQTLLRDRDHALPAGRVEHRMLQRDRKQLVWAASRIIAAVFGIDNVVQILAVLDTRTAR